MKLRIVGVAAPIGAALCWIGCVASGVVEERPTGGLPEAGPGLFDEPETGGPCELRCSGDLRSVDDCRGNVAKACGESEGCSKGECISACAAAEAAQGVVGCEFFVAPLDLENYWSEYPKGTCSAAMIVNGGRAPVSVSFSHHGEPVDIGDRGRIPITRGGTIEYAPLPADGKVPAEGIAIFFLQQTAEGMCPVPALETGPMLRGTGFGDTFRIETSLPVNAYSVLPALTANATLALLYPASSWGTSYVTAIAEPGDLDGDANHLGGEHTGFVVVAKEETTLLVTPSADVVGKPDVGIRSVAAHASRQFRLPAGGTLQLSQQANLSGSVVVADKPIGVLSTALWLPQASRHQQLAPVQATGHRYAAVRPRDHTPQYPEKHGWRFVGMVDGTKLTYEPEAPIDAPTELGRGEVFDLEADDRFVVASQDADHPFALVEGTRSAQGTPFGSVIFESVSAVGLDQFVSAQLFYTVPGFDHGHLVVVREADKNGVFHEVELDCLGGVKGWNAIDSGGKFQYALLDTPMFDYDTHASYCDLGRRSMKSSAPFGVTVWGWQNPYGNRTYAYPAALGLRPVNSVNVNVQ